MLKLLRGLLVVLAIVFGALLSAVSLTRIAGEHLGFPPGLEWTFTGVVDVGAIAGAITWVMSEPRTRERRTGVVTNISCTAVSALFVGLDHVTDATTGWGFGAMVVGVFMPLLSTWLVHDLVQSRADDAIATAKPPAAPRRRAAEPRTAKPVEPPKPTTVAERVAQTPPAPSAPVGDPPAVAFARANWPVTAGEIQNGAQVSKATAYRALSKVREEKAHDRVAA